MTQLQDEASGTCPVSECGGAAFPWGCPGFDGYVDACAHHAEGCLQHAMHTAARARLERACAGAVQKAAKAVLQKLLQAAEDHGKDSDPEMEVGDLQGILYTCWRLLTPAQRSEVYKEHEDLVTEWYGGKYR
jgi:hypothetical protein